MENKQKKKEKEIRYFRADMSGTDIYEIVDAIRCLLGAADIQISEDLYNKIPENKKRYFILVPRETK